MALPVIAASLRASDARLALVAVAAVAASGLGLARVGDSASTIGRLEAGDQEVRVNGVFAPPGTPLQNGARVDAVSGTALVAVGPARVGLGEGTAVSFSDTGDAATLHHGRAQLELSAAAEPSRFRVRAGGASLELEGTRFSVERTRTDDRVVVAVQEGQARITARDGHRTLTSGQSATLVGGRLSRERRSAEPERALQTLKQRAGRLVDDWSP